ncbi:MAG: translation initiation factor IF-2, partial [Minisyncoccia bacterium]
LDYIRKTNIAAREAGGITQSVGAYEIVYKDKKITFIDTPGHEAFFAMRQKGSLIADIAVLVVAADEGVKPQTKEAYQHIQNSKIPFIVAINKIDKKNADLQRTKQSLADSGIFLEGYGGNVSWEAISAKTGEGVEKLLDLILFLAEVEDLSYNPNSIPTGFVLTSSLDKRRGNEIGIILKDGILKKGQFIQTISAQGKVKILENFQKKQVNELIAGMPGLILGFDNLPSIGEQFFAHFDKEQLNKAIKLEDKEVKNKGSDQENKIKIILVAAESGSLEALEFLIKNNPELNNKFFIFQKFIGDIYENVVKTADIVKAIIIGFKVKIDSAAKNLANAHRIKIITGDIIYELEKQVKEYLENLLQPKRIVEILAIFDKKGKQQIVGGKVLNDFVKNYENFEIMRGSRIVGDGRILNMQLNKVDVQQVEQGNEFGMLVESNIELKKGDKLAF